MVKSLPIPTRGSVGQCLVVVPASTVITSHPCSGCWFILTPVLAGWVRLALLPCGRRASNGVSGGKVGGWGLSQPQAPTEGALPCPSHPLVLGRALQLPPTQYPPAHSHRFDGDYGPSLQAKETEAT